MMEAQSFPDLGRFSSVEGKAADVDLESLISALGGPLFLHFCCHVCFQKLLLLDVSHSFSPCGVQKRVSKSWFQSVKKKPLNVHVFIRDQLRHADK